MVKYAVMLNGITELAMMKLDVLDDLNSIKICTAYRCNGKKYTDFPMDSEMISNAHPVYEEMPGWQISTRGVRSYTKLPANAKKYIERLEKVLKARIKYISVGTKRDEIVVR